MECRFFLSSNGPFDVHLVDPTSWTTMKSWRATIGKRRPARADQNPESRTRTML
jgi:hypothetical protein